MRRTRRPIRRLLATTLLLGSVALLGCAFGEFRPNDPLDRELSLEEAQHRYTVLVRFNSFEKASKYVAPEDRDAYLANFPSFREVRFTEYESDRIELDPEMQKATLEVRYFGYTPSMPVEIIITEKQEWTRRPGVGNYWYVKSTFSGLPEVVAQH